MNELYQPPEKGIWKGRKSSSQLYLHEKVTMVNLLDTELVSKSQQNLGILGYACDEGVRRNQGRVGAKEGPDAIRSIFSKMPNHLPADYNLLDCGNLICKDQDMEATQEALAQQINRLNKENVFCVVLGGGHDVAYGHYKGLRQYLGSESVLGIINFDAHFDLRSNQDGNNSGTPFYQIGMDCRTNKIPFPYLCLGIRKDANDRSLYDTTSVLGVNYMEIERFHSSQIDLVNREIEYFINGLDAVYVTIDLDGFSSAFAPGVSAPSPLGFNPETVNECLKTIIHSKKLVGLDIAEMNPKFDLDQQTARLAAGLMHFVLHRVSLL
ncbi:MAG: formimidoylglutamase [Flavobacteriaceae bacterium]